MSKRSVLRFLVAALAALAALAVMPNAAQASTAASGSTARVIGFVSVQLVHTQDGVTTVHQAVVTPLVICDGPSPAGTKTAAVVQPNCGTTVSYTPVVCGHAYSFPSTWETFSWQRTCGSKIGAWGVKLASAVGGLATGEVTETGMSWYINGIKKGQNSPHLEPWYYQFHGSFNPIATGQDVMYTDTFTFPDATGTDTIFMNGGVKLSS